MDDMVGHLCSISKKRFIISFAPYTPIYAALKMLGSLAPGPSKVCGLCGWGGGQLGADVLPTPNGWWDLPYSPSRWGWD